MPPVNMIDRASLLWDLGSGGMDLGHCISSIFFLGDVETSGIAVQARG